MFTAGCCNQHPIMNCILEGKGIFGDPTKTTNEEVFKEVLRESSEGSRVIPCPQWYLYIKFTSEQTSIPLPRTCPCQRRCVVVYPGGVSSSPSPDGQRPRLPVPQVEAAGGWQIDAIRAHLRRIVAAADHIFITYIYNVHIYLTILNLTITR